MFCHFYKGDNFCDCLFALLHAKYSFIRVDPSSEGRQNIFDRVNSPESVSFPLKPLIYHFDLNISTDMHEQIM